MNTHAVIFDWGGVLMRTHDYTRRHEWDARLGLPPWSVERVVHGSAAWMQAQRGEISVEAYWQAVADELGLSAKALTLLRHDFYADDRLDEDLIALIRELREQGVKVGLLSNNSVAVIELMEALSIVDLFDVRVISAEIGILKPDPRAYHAILQQLSVRPEQSLFIDDSPVNVDGAQAIGMAAVQFQASLDLRETVRRWLDGEEMG